MKEVPVENYIRYDDLASSVIIIVAIENTCYKHVANKMWWKLKNGTFHIKCNRIYYLVQKFIPQLLKFIIILY